MGLVLSFTFGTTFRNRSMIVRGLRNEVSHLSSHLCFYRILLGLLFAFTGVDDNRDWPTADEMASRRGGDKTGLLAGAIIVFFYFWSGDCSQYCSGMTGGVAISLSLLPPAVNGGICWMYHAVILLASGSVDRNEGDTEQHWELGTASFGLTIANIICIWLAGVFTLRLKEVSPYKKKNAFWSSRDIEIYRTPETKSTADVETINDGIKAMMELWEAAGDNVSETAYEDGG